MLSEDKVGDGGGKGLLGNHEKTSEETEVLNTCQDQSAEPRSEQYWSYKNVPATLPFLHPLNHNPTGVRMQLGLGTEGKKCSVLKEKRRWPCPYFPLEVPCVWLTSAQAGRCRLKF